MRISHPHLCNIFRLTNLSFLLLMIIIIIIIVFAGLYLHTVSETKLVVDTSRGETLRINVIIVLFLKLICLLFFLEKKHCMHLLFSQIILVQILCNTLRLLML